MQSRLSGLARKWYDNLSSYELSWNEWKTLLLKSFPEHQDYATSLRKLLNRRKLPSEGWEEYYFDKMDMINACEIKPKHAVSCLIDGIDNPTMLIREEQARELKLKINASSVTITGYGASKVSVLGETEFTIELDNAEANVKAFVVPNAAQEVSVMVGQPFLSLPHVVMIVAEGKVRILSSSDDINEVLQSAPRKIPLWAKETVVVPPKTTAMIAVTSRNAVNGEVYVPGGLRSVPNREHYIGECITQGEDGFVSLTNISQREIEVIGSRGRGQV
ncbi:uncharacterized protein [Leptinotarsa decemlineata]|uniref:uncharacterized protein n=1 Tax=Leptinotarsa decemlineata TaxID=7539 RepID=UPI003D307A49